MATLNKCACTKPLDGFKKVYLAWSREDSYYALDHSIAMVAIVDPISNKMLNVG